MSQTTRPPRWEPDVAVRPYTPADEAAVIGLLQTCLEGWRTAEAVQRFRWKHEHSPFGESQRVVAVAGGRIVAFMAWMAWRVVYDGQEFVAWRGTDLAVDPAMQRQGVFQQIRRYRAQCPEEQDLSFNHRNERSDGAMRKAGAAGGRRLTRHLAPLRPLQIVAWQRSGRPGSARCDAFASVDEVLEDEAAAEDLLSRAVPTGRLATARSVALLRWRYAQFPGRRYVGHELREGDGRLRGLLIGRCAPGTERSPAYFEVSELIVPEDDRAAMRRLLRRVLRVRAPYAAVVLPMPFRSGWEALAAGFPVAREGGWLFGAWALRDGPVLAEDLGDPRRWMLPLGDLEAV